MLVTVRSVSKRTTRNRRTMVNVRGRRRVGPDGRRVLQPAVARDASCTEGLQIALFGKADTYRGGLQMSNPVVDLIGDRTGRIVPIYPQSEKAQISHVGDRRLGRGGAAAVQRARHRRPRPGGGSLTRLGLVDRADGASGRSTLPESMREKETGATPAGLRRTAAGATRAGAAQARARTESRAVSSTPSTASSSAGSTRRCRTRSDRRPAAGDRRDRARSRRHRIRCTGCCRATSASGKTVVAVATMLAAVQGGHQGGADGADRGARRTARRRACGRCSAA